MYPESCDNVKLVVFFQKTFCQLSASYFVLMDLLKSFFFLLIMCNICMTSYQQQLFIQFRQNMHIFVYIIFIPVDYLLIREKSCKIFQRHYLRYLCSPVQSCVLLFKWLSTCTQETNQSLLVSQFMQKIKHLHSEFLIFFHILLHDIQVILLSCL